MRGYLFGLLLPLALGCAGKNTVAGEEKSKSQQLEESLPTWCKTACVKLKGCEKEYPCDCGGDTCSCAGAGDDCEAECKQTLERYAKGGESCALVGQHLQQCVDRSTCTQIFSGNACAGSDEDEALCPTETETSSQPSGGGGYVDMMGSNGGYPIPTAGSSSGGSSSAGDAGASSGGASASGGATGELAVSCSSRFSGGPTPDNTSTNEICEGGSSDCTDGHEYRYLCARTSDGLSACSCLVDGDVTGAFDPGVNCPTQAALNTGCHWNIAF
jgi:hypothetical protein